MTTENQARYDAAMTMLDAVSAMRKARRLLLIAGDTDAAADALAASEAISVFADALINRVRCNAPAR